MKPGPERNQTRCYQIRVQGHLNHHWEDWLDGLEIAYEDHAITALTGPVSDQPQLFGLLMKIRDMGLTLISMQEIVHEEDERNQRSAEG